MICFFPTGERCEVQKVSGVASRRLGGGTSLAPTLQGRGYKGNGCAELPDLHFPWFRKKSEDVAIPPLGVPGTTLLGVNFNLSELQILRIYSYEVCFFSAWERSGVQRVSGIASRWHIGGIPLASTLQVCVYSYNRCAVLPDLHFTKFRKKSEDVATPPKNIFSQSFKE